MKTKTYNQLDQLLALIAIILQFLYYNIDKIKSKKIRAMSLINSFHSLSFSKILTSRKAKIYLYN